MKKIFFLVFLFVSSLFSMQNLKANYFLEASADVQDMFYKENSLYVATSGGVLDVFDIKKKQIIKTITIPNIKDFMGDEIPAKLYSVDGIDEKLLIVSQGEKGYRDLWLYLQNKLIKKIDIKKKFFIRKARFLDENKVVFALLSNEFVVYDLSTNTQKKIKQISSSAFSDFTLSEDKKRIITTDESGVIRVLDSLTLKEIKVLKAINLDKVFQVAYKNQTVLTAGQDRKSVLYKNNNKIEEFKFDFLLYSCGLNKDASLGAVAYNENNEVLVFSTKNMKKLYNLVENKAVITKILFIENKELFVSSESNKINFWSLP